MNKLLAYHRKHPERTIILLLIIFYLVGLAGMFYPKTKPIIIFLIPYTILMNFVLMLFYHKPWTIKFIIISLTIIILGFSIESIGVHTGIIFGGYTYGERMGVKIFETPLLIGINWLFVVYSAYILVKKIKLHFVFKAMVGGLLLVCYDILLEPFAMSYDMWTWIGGIVPLQNYAAWFIISFVFLCLFYAFKIKASNKLAIPIISIQSAFFVILFITGY